MTGCLVALVNVVMWTRDQFFLSAMRTPHGNVLRLSFTCRDE